MPHYNLALLGFGNVGKAFVRLLTRKRDQLLAEFGLDLSITGVYTKSHGSALNPKGFDLSELLKKDLFALSTVPAPQSSFEFIQKSNAICGANILFENSPVNYVDGQPAVDHLRMALELGMHAVTANKGPVVHAYRELTDLAKSRQKRFFFEAAVMDGAPIFSLFREALPAANLRAFRGILNSTTNMILSLMEKGETFEQAVIYCQRIGIAETDPSGDVDGWDASVKVAALVTVLMDCPLKPDQVDRQGIRSITAEEIGAARQQGKRWKLICSAERQQDRVISRVAPELVSADSPLYGVNGTSSTVQFETDVLGKLTVLETDPGPEATAYGLLADMINALR